MQGNHVAISEPDDSYGLVYVYKLKDGKLIQLQKLRSSIQQRDVRFGAAIALSQEWFLISTPGCEFWLY